ncbi:MAG: hypothetical protein WBD57_07850 [Candidatus Cybelea sp.]
MNRRIERQRIRTDAWCLAVSLALVGCGQAAQTAPPPARTSWMAPAKKALDLLYVSDPTTGLVYAFSYPGGQLQGTISGIIGPVGLCSDKSGDVFVSNFGASDILEYAHGGTSPISTLVDSGYFPEGCSVDPNSGDLAVTNYCQGSGNQCIGSGNIAVYQNASGSPAYYSGPIRDLYYCSYDDRGNLFVDGQSDPVGVPELGELKRGASSYETITVDRHLYWPGGIQWDGKYVALGDSEAGGKSTSSVHLVRIAGRKGTVVQTMRLAGSGAIEEFTIFGSKLIGPDAKIPADSSDVRIWNYPTGGQPTKVITDDFLSPAGTTISVGR